MRTSAPSASIAAHLVVGNQVRQADDRARRRPPCRHGRRRGRDCRSRRRRRRRRRASSESDSTALVAPRSLKLPVVWWCSHLMETGTPARRDEPVRRTQRRVQHRPAMRFRASRIRENGIMPRAPMATRFSPGRARGSALHCGHRRNTMSAPAQSISPICRDRTADPACRRRQKTVIFSLDTDTALRNAGDHKNIRGHPRAQRIVPVRERAERSTDVLDQLAVAGNSSSSNAIRKDHEHGTTLNTLSHTLSPPSPRLPRRP